MTEEIKTDALDSKTPDNTSELSAYEQIKEGLEDAIGMPEEIWAGKHSEEGKVWDDFRWASHSVKFIRADIHEELAERYRMLVNGCIEESEIKEENAKLQELFDAQSEDYNKLVSALEDIVKNEAHCQECFAVLIAKKALKANNGTTQ